MALDFPDAPTTGQLFTGAGVTWKWDGGKWISGTSDAWSSFPDAPNDGFGYGRRNLDWAKVLLLTGGTVTGPTTIEGTIFASGGSVGAWYAPPPGSGALLAGGDVVVRNAVGTNIYYSNIIGNWCYWNNGSGFLMSMDINVAPAMNFFTAPVGTAGTAPVLTTQLAVRSDGVVVTPWFSTASGATIGTNLYVTGALLINPANSWEWYFQRDASGNHIENHRPNWWTQWANADGTWSWNSPSGSCMTLDGGGTLITRGRVETATYLRAAGGDGSGWGLSVSQSGWFGGNVQCTDVHSTNAYVSGTVSGAAVTATSDLNVSGNSYVQWMRSGGGISIYNGTIWCADTSNCYLQRGSGDGTWRFVEWGTVNCEVRSGGDLYVRSSVLSYGTIYCRNASTGVRYESGAYSTSNGFLFGWNNVIGGLACVSVDNGGAVYAMANASDARLKGEIANSDHDCLATIKALALRKFRWKTDMDGPWGLAKSRIRDGAPQTRVGLVAQEVREVFPEGVQEGDDFADHLGRVWGLDQNAMIALLVGALQQVADRLTVVESRA